MWVGLVGICRCWALVGWQQEHVVWSWWDRFCGEYYIGRGMVFSSIVVFGGLLSEGGLLRLGVSQI